MRKKNLKETYVNLDSIYGTKKLNDGTKLEKREMTQQDVKKAFMYPQGVKMNSWS